MEINKKLTKEEQDNNSNSNVNNDENLFKNTINSLDEAIFILDRSNPPAILECNKAAEKIFGYNKKDMLGRTTAFLHVNETYLKRFQDKLYPNLIEKDHFHIYPFKMKKSNGEIFFTEHFVNLRRDKEGNEVGWISSIRDITEMRKIKRKLEASEEKFRKISEKANDGIILIDDQGKIVYWNTAAERIYGYKPEEALEEFLHHLIMPKEEYEMFNRVMETFRENHTAPNMGKPIEYEAVRKNGKKIPIEVSYSSLELAGKWNILGIVRDRSEIMEHLRTIKEQNERLNQLDKYRTDLIRRISHELKTPLISIKGFADLLLNLHSQKFDIDVINIIEEISDGCNRLQNLISDLLQSSRLESGKVQLNKKVEDLSFLIRFCVRELKPLADRRDQHILLNINKDLTCNIEKERIYEAITNLLSNAIKYSPPGKRIEIETTLDDKNIIVSIKDDGIGFTEEEKSQIFQKFGKIERYGKGWNVDSEGTGLGLYITKQIIELHGGKIWVESEGRNKGSIFYFSLPRSSR
ncbi:MAG: putative Histidine kinase [Promethearchaeota archaeon]|nr:MAG: putative Histidine kinase [Candidatus Lokiarchaeota archaeon]